MSKIEQAAREVIRQHSMECLSDKAVDSLREALAEQAEQEPVSKALLLATDALVYHTEQTRPIQKTDEAIIYLRNVMAQGVSSMAFTLEDAMAKYPEISYWHNEFLKHNTTSESAEQEPVHWVVPDFGFLFPSEDAAQRYLINIESDARPTPCYATPVRTKDLTDDELAQAVGSPLDEVYLADFRAVIAADREKNRG